MCANWFVFTGFARRGGRGHREQKQPPQGEASIVSLSPGLVSLLQPANNMWFLLSYSLSLSLTSLGAGVGGGGVVFPCGVATPGVAGEAGGEGGGGAREVRRLLRGRV